MVYLSHAFMVGGAEEMVLNLVRRLPARFEPAVVCIHERRADRRRDSHGPACRSAVLGLNPGHVAATRRAATAGCPARDGSPTIVHTFLLTGSLYGRFAAMMAGVPIVIGTEVNIYENKRPRTPASSGG